MIDYMVMEAVAIKAMKEDREVERTRQVSDFKKDFSSLDHLR